MLNKIYKHIPKKHNGEVNWDQIHFPIFFGLMMMVFITNRFKTDLFAINLPIALFTFIISIIVFFKTARILESKIRVAESKKELLSGIGALICFIDISLFIIVSIMILYKYDIYGVLGIIIYFTIYYIILSAPVLSFGSFLRDNAKIISDK